MKKRAGSSTRSHHASKNGSSRFSAIRNSVRTAIRFRPTDLSEPDIVGQPIAQLEVGGKAKLHSVTEQMTELLKYLSDIGLQRGTAIEVVEKAPLGGPITIAYDGRRQAISLDLAKQLTVTEL